MGASAEEEMEPEKRTWALNRKRGHRHRIRPSLDGRRAGCARRAPTKKENGTSPKGGKAKSRRGRTNSNLIASCQNRGAAFLGSKIVSVARVSAACV